MTLGRPSPGNVMSVIHHLVLHLAVTFKHWERTFHKCKIVLGVAIWWQHSSNTEVKWCLLLVVSLGSAAGNEVGFPGWCRNRSRELALRPPEGRCLAARWAEGRAPLEPSRRALPSACSQRWPWTASQRGRSVVFSSYWITLVPGAESLPFISGERNSML